MAGPGLGLKSYMQIGPKEATYGTFQTPTKKLEVVSFNVAPNIGVIRDSSLSNSPSRRGLYQGGYNFKGTFVVRANYEGLLELFRGVAGGYSHAVADTTAHDHLFKEAAALNSYSIEVAMGDVPTNNPGKVFRLLGAKFSGLTVRGTAGTGNDAMLMCEFTVVAKDMTSVNTPTGALAFPAILPILYHQATIVDSGVSDLTGDARVRSFEFALENPLAEDRFYLGSVNADEPLRQDFLKATFKFTQEFTTAGQFEAARAFAVASPVLLFKHPDVIGATTKTREFELHANQANIVEFSDPVDAYGVLVSTCTLEAFLDPIGDASSYAMRFTNTETALP